MPNDIKHLAVLVTTLEATRAFVGCFSGLLEGWRGNRPLLKIEVGFQIFEIFSKGPLAPLEKTRGWSRVLRFEGYCWTDLSQSTSASKSCRVPLLLSLLAFQEITAMLPLTYPKEGMSLSRVGELSAAPFPSALSSGTPNTGHLSGMIMSLISRSKGIPCFLALDLAPAHRRYAGPLSSCHRLAYSARQPIHLVLFDGYVFDDDNTQLHSTHLLIPLANSSFSCWISLKSDIWFDLQVLQM